MGEKPAKIQGPGTSVKLQVQGQIIAPCKKKEVRYSVGLLRLWSQHILNWEILLWPMYWVRRKAARSRVGPRAREGSTAGSGWGSSSSAMWASALADLVMLEVSVVDKEAGWSLWKASCFKFLCVLKIL